MHSSILAKRKQLHSKQSFPSKEAYEGKLKLLQEDLVKIQSLVKMQKKKVILVFEGADASGKGGTIKRLTSELDPKTIQLHSISAPSVEEKQEFYLERFWRKLPKPGTITIFDRSWYGKVLVERVEKLTSVEAYKRAYHEINSFEKMLTDENIIILKYFLDITYDEQLARFTERKNNPFKSWKLTDDDWKNRKNWDQYYQAFKAMLKKTHTKNSPWKIVAADSKWFARITILQDFAANVRQSLSQ